MALFNNNGNGSVIRTERTKGSASPDELNLIGRGATFEGTLRAEGDVRISGRVEGQLVGSARVIVAEGGMVEGELYAAAADVAGRVDGELHVEERLVLKPTARVEGTVQAGRLIVEEGAVFSGECAMGTMEAAREALGVVTEVARPPMECAEEAEEEAPEETPEELEAKIETA